MIRVYLKVQWFIVALDIKGISRYQITEVRGLHCHCTLYYNHCIGSAGKCNVSMCPNTNVALIYAKV